MIYFLCWETNIFLKTHSSLNILSGKDYLLGKAVCDPTWEIMYWEKHQTMQKNLKCSNIMAWVKKTVFCPDIWLNGYGKFAFLWSEHQAMPSQLSVVCGLWPVLIPPHQPLISHFSNPCLHFNQLFISLAHWYPKLFICNLSHPSCLLLSSKTLLLEANLITLS